MPSTAAGAPPNAVSPPSPARRKPPPCSAPYDRAPAACVASIPVPFCIGCWPLLSPPCGCLCAPGASPDSRHNCHDRYRWCGRPVPESPSTHGPGRIGRASPSAVSCCPAAETPPTILSSPSPDGSWVRPVSASRVPSAAR